MFEASFVYVPSTDEAAKTLMSADISSRPSARLMGSLLSRDEAVFANELSRARMFSTDIVSIWLECSILTFFPNRLRRVIS